jgi:hypothetical protein
MLMLMNALQLANLSGMSGVRGGEARREVQREKWRRVITYGGT